MRCGAILFGCVVLAVSAIASAQEAGAPSPIPACIQVSTDSRYVPYGYNHVVVLKSGCSKPAACTVSTDVNPAATSAEVAAGTTVEVLTFAASPSQTFHARVTCKLR
jgi:hypothetical protein